MTEPITPPPELFKQWEDDILTERDNVDHVLDCAWKDGFRAGADQELEACCIELTEKIITNSLYEGGETPRSSWRELASMVVRRLRAARRPKPPSLKAQALAVIENSAICDHLSPEHAAILRRALEALPND